MLLNDLQLLPNMSNVPRLLALATRCRSVGCSLADGYAAAGFQTSAAAWAEAKPQLKPRTQGELPRVPTLPQRSLLLRKLVEYQRAAQLPKQHVEQLLTEKQQIRAARRAAAQHYLAAVQAAAANQDIQLLLTHLATAAAAAHPSSSSSSDLTSAPTPEPIITTINPAAATLPPSGNLVAAAAVAAVKSLSAASGRPEHAQAFLELAIERGLLQPQQVQRAVHAVLQAYISTGDHRGALAAAARFFDTGSGSSLLPPGSKPTSCTLTLLLEAAAATREPDLLIGTWKYFGHQWQQQQQQQQQPLPVSSSSNEKGGQGSIVDFLPPPNVLHALMYGAVGCDLAAAGIQLPGSSSSSSSTSSSSSQCGLAAAAAGNSMQQPISPSLFHSDTTTVELLRDINHKLQQYWQQQQQQQLRQQQQKRKSKGEPGLPVQLLHPCQASELLRYTSSTADVDVLLLSQLYQLRGLAVHDLIKIAKRARIHQQQHAAAAAVDLDHDLQQQDLAVQSGARSDQTVVSQAVQSRSGCTNAGLAMSNHLLTVLPDLKLINIPHFPPKLRSDVARSAVQAYLRHGAVQRAAAVAHAAAVANPRDLQQYHLLVRGYAAAGQLLPALTVIDNIRNHLWQSVSPAAQADMLRALTRCDSGPPLGAAPRPSRLITFFRKRCSPHPKTWGALLQGLVITGDLGPRVWKGLHSAMIQPYNFMAMAGFSPMFVDKARSQIVAQLIRGVLAAAESGSSLASVAAESAEAKASVARMQGNSAAAAAAAAGSSKGVAAGTERLRRALLLPATSAAVVNAPSSVQAWQQQQQQNKDVSLADLLQQQEAVPGVSLHEQPVHLRNQVHLVLTIFDVLHSWKVTLHDDAALAAALQVLRYCSSTDDAHESGLLVAVLRSGLALGIKPGRATLRALLSCCADLDLKSHSSIPMGSATGLGLQVQGLGVVDLPQVLAACEAAVAEGYPQQQHQQQQVHEVTRSQDDKAFDGQQGLQQQHVHPDITLDSSSSSSSSSRNREVQQVAGDLLRQWAFNSTFAWVDGVLSHGPTWALRPEAEIQPSQVLDSGSSSSSSGSSAVASAVGL